MGTPDEVAGVIAFLASPDAAYAKGDALLVDAGLLIAGIRARV